MAVVGGAETFITTSSDDVVHGGLETVHRRVAEAPIVNPVTVELF